MKLKSHIPTPQKRPFQGLWRWVWSAGRKQGGTKQKRQVGTAIIPSRAPVVHLLTWTFHPEVCPAVVNTDLFTDTVIAGWLITGEGGEEGSDQRDHLRRREKCSLSSRESRDGNRDASCCFRHSVTNAKRGHLCDRLPGVSQRSWEWGSEEALGELPSFETA